MNLITQSAASKLAYAPSRAYLSKICNKPNRPNYFVPKDEHVYIDTDHTEWKALIRNRKLAAATGTVVGGNTNNLDPVAKKTKPKKQSVKKAKPKKRTEARPLFKKVEPEKIAEKKDPVVIEQEMEFDDMAARMARAKVEKAELETAKLKWEIRRKKIQAEKETKDLVEFSFAEYYFFSYLEKVNSSMLRLPKKLKPQIVNYCLEKDPEGLLKYLQVEIETTLREAKLQQKKGLEELELEMEEADDE